MYNKRVMVLNKKEQEAVAVAATELIRNCKIDYYPEEGRTSVHYVGPNRFNIIQQEVNTVRIKTERVKE